MNHNILHHCYVANSVFRAANNKMKLMLYFMATLLRIYLRTTKTELGYCNNIFSLQCKPE